MLHSAMLRIGPPPAVSQVPVLTNWKLHVSWGVKGGGDDGGGGDSMGGGAGGELVMQREPQSAQSWASAHSL